MDQKEKLVIFHLYRRDGTALFLHPFDNVEKLVSVFRKSEVEGRYGAEPRVESLTTFRNDLYRMIEEAVKGWISEARFIPRLLVSAVVFLLVYLFLSFAVRDPVPMVDELVGATISAFVVYFLMSRRDQRSSAALKKRGQYRMAVDRIVFTEDPFVKEVEESLQQIESESTEEILLEMLTGIGKTFRCSDERATKQLTGYLERRFSTREYRKQERLLARLMSDVKDRRNVAAVGKWSEAKKIDLSLFAIYRRAKSSSGRTG